MRELTGMIGDMAVIGIEIVDMGDLLHALRLKGIETVVRFR